MSSTRFSYATTGLVRAEARHVRSSARKVRLVLEDIRGRSVLDARKQLLFSPRAVAKDIELVLRSAVTNAEVNHGLSPDDLVIHEAFANEGVTIKRFKPRAKGRASRIRKRTSHIVILLRSTTGDVIVAGGDVATETPKKATDSARAKRVAASQKADAGAEVESDAAATAEAAAATEATPKKAPAKPRVKKSDAEAAADAPAAAKKAPAKPRAKKADGETAAVKKPAAPRKKKTDDGEKA
jgi:large subunit ribosomal protein L22